MDITEKIKAAKFSNEAAQEICLSMVNHMAEFTKRKKGYHFRGIMLSLADCFQEDKDVILKLVGTSQRKEIPSGGAKITRGKDKLKGHSNMISSGGDGGEDCDGCNPVDTLTSAGNSNAKPRTQANKKITDKAKSEFTSIEKVMNSFGGQANPMLAFTQSQGIELPTGVKRPKTIAKYIVEHYSSDEE